MCVVGVGAAGTTGTGEMADATANDEGDPNDPKAKDEEEQKKSEFFETITCKTQKKDDHKRGQLKLKLWGNAGTLDSIDLHIYTALQFQHLQRERLLQTADV